MVYLLAAAFTSIALPWCRKPWQALLSTVRIVGLIARGAVAAAGQEHGPC